jgi:hypothetical protein
LLSENLPLTPSGKTERAPALKLAKWVFITCKIAGKPVELSLKKCCITNALDYMEDDILWDNPDLDCLGLKSYLEESVDSECETG